MSRKQQTNRKYSEFRPESRKKCNLTKVWSDEKVVSAAAALEDIKGMETAALAHRGQCVWRPYFCASLWQSTLRGMNL